MLGAGQEVGRSCCVLQYHDKTIVLDAGVHPAHSGMASLPFVDELDWSTVDAILITQYVLDSLKGGTELTVIPQFSLGPCCSVDLRYGEGEKFDALSQILNLAHSTPFFHSRQISEMGKERCT